MKKKIKKTKKPLLHPVITYRGWPGHFCCSQRCVFHLNTLIEYKRIKIVVSTVGLMQDPMNKDANKVVFAEIGMDRYFETMAFHAKKNGTFWDANVQRQIYFDLPWSWGLKDEAKANAGHIKIVEEMAFRLLTGETFKIIKEI
ncbi:hypothetical protein ACFLQL_01615 [Verrucomicrobiota bacterium]